MNIDNFVPSTLKVTASESLHIDNDLKKVESSKTLDQLLDDQEKENAQENSERK